MGCLDIEQAARASGLSAREVRTLIEQGRLPATRPGGRWMIDRRHLAAATPTRPRVAGARPIGADPVAEAEAEPSAAATAHDQDAATVLARLEEAMAQISDLRVERDELRLRLREQVSSLQHSLQDSIEELDEARARIDELQRSGPRPLSTPRPARPSENSTPSGPAHKKPGGGARDALTPLFRATTQPRDIG